MGGLRLTISALTLVPRIVWLHRPRSSEHRQLHTTHVYTATNASRCPPRACRRTPVVVPQIPRAIAENTRQMLNTAVPTTRGRVHSPEVKQPHGKRNTRKQDVWLFASASNTHQNCNSRVGEPICTKSVSWKVVERRRLNSRPYTRRHMHICKRGDVNQNSYRRRYHGHRGC